MLHAIGQHAQRQRFGMGQRISPGFAVSQTAGQIHDLGNPAAIRFAVEFDFQIHNRKLNQRPLPVESESALEFSRRDFAPLR